METVGFVSFVWPFNHDIIDIHLVLKKSQSRSDGKWAMCDQWSRDGRRCIGYWLVKEIKK